MESLDSNKLSRKLDKDYVLSRGKPKHPNHDVPPELTLYMKNPMV